METRILYCQTGSLWRHYEVTVSVSCHAGVANRNRLSGLCAATADSTKAGQDLISSLALTVSETLQRLMSCSALYQHGRWRLL